MGSTPTGATNLLYFMAKKRIKADQVLDVDKKRAKEKLREGAFYVAPGMSYGGRSKKRIKKERDPGVDYSKTMAGKEPGNNSKKTFSKKRLKRY